MLARVAPPSLETIKLVVEAAATTLPLVEMAMPFQLALAAPNFAQVACHRPVSGWSGW